MTDWEEWEEIDEGLSRFVGSYADCIRKKGAGYFDEESSCKEECDEFCDCKVDGYPTYHTSLDLMREVEKKILEDEKLSQRYFSELYKYTNGILNYKDFLKFATASAEVRAMAAWKTLKGE